MFMPMLILFFNLQLFLVHFLMICKISVLLVSKHHTNLGTKSPTCNGGEYLFYCAAAKSQHCFHVTKQRGGSSFIQTPPPLIHR